jgi:hypothetical protein
MTTNCKYGLLKALEDVGDYLLPEKTLFAEVNIRCAIPVSWTDFRKLLEDYESKRRIVSQQTEDGPKWKITDNGRARLAEMT